MSPSSGGHDLDDAELLRSFEACTLPPGSFHHADHVRLAWLLLGAEPLCRALTRFSEGLRRYAASLARSEHYHETITVAYMLLIHERRNDDPGCTTFAAFAERNPDLLRWPGSALARYYRPETLASARARQHFVLPDRLLRAGRSRRRRFGRRLQSAAVLGQNPRAQSPDRPGRRSQGRALARVARKGGE